MMDELETLPALGRAQAHAAAAQGEAAPGPGTQPWLLAALPEQEAQIEAAVVYFHTTPDEQVLSSAAEWLLDNFYLARQSLRQIREDLPHGFYRQLPKLTAGPLAGYPRFMRSPRNWSHRAAPGWTWSRCGVMSPSTRSSVR